MTASASTSVLDAPVHTSSVVGIALYSVDAPALAGFYERAFGLAFEHRAHTSGAEHWIGELGDVRFEIKAMAQDASGERTPDWASSDRPEGISRAEVSLHVADVAAALAVVVREGGAAHGAPAREPWGDFAVALDPDGNRIGLYSPLGKD